MNHGKKFIILPLIIGLALQSSEIIAGGIDHQAQKLNFRASVAVGARYLGSQVMSGDEWGNLLQISFAALYNLQKTPCYIGLNIAGNSAWASRFNSVNSAGNTNVMPVGIYNSPSLDFLATFGYKGHYAGVELNGGYEVSWVKWRNSTQLATSGVRGAPKIRLAVIFTLTKNTDFFIAGSYAFNTYGNLSCANNAFNCFNDSGYVGVAEITLGVSCH
jgi:hypothetical protein